MKASGGVARAVCALAAAVALAACTGEESNDPERSESAVSIRAPERGDWRPGQQMEAEWGLPRASGVKLRLELAERSREGVTVEVVAKDSVHLNDVRADESYTTELAIPEDLSPGRYSLVQEVRFDGDNRTKGVRDVRVRE